MLDGNFKALPAPPAGKDWLAAVKKEWTALWAHPISSTYDRNLHEAPLRRLFDLRDERERYRRVVRNAPLVQGSQGQTVANPLRSLMTTIDSEIRQLEDRFGLSTASLLKLGINLGQARKSLNDLLGELDDDDGDEGDEEDPRVAPQAIDARSTRTRKT